MNNTTIDEIKEKVLPILRKAGVSRSAVFGSYAHGQQNENSDIDILVDYPRGKGLFEFVGLKNELENALGKSVDLVEYDALNSLLKERILAEQIRII